jgi:TonB family protein
VSPVSLVSCAGPGVGTPDAVWHRVHASGFTFCVPPSWRPSGPSRDSIDAKQWHGDGGSLTWDLGLPRSFTGPDVVLKVTGSVVVGNNPRPVPEEPHLCSPRKTTLLRVDATNLLVTEVECQRQWTITAWSTLPAMYVQSEGFSESVADVLRLIMETIHFAASGSRPHSRPPTITSCAGLVMHDSAVYDDSQVTERPILRNFPPLRYPEREFQHRLQGRVIIGATIKADGSVDSSSVRVIQSVDSALDREALRWVPLSSYWPGCRDGLPVRVRVAIPVVFLR